MRPQRSPVAISSYCCLSVWRARHSMLSTAAAVSRMRRPISWYERPSSSRNTRIWCCERGRPLNACRRSSSSCRWSTLVSVRGVREMRISKSGKKSSESIEISSMRDTCRR